MALVSIGPLEYDVDIIICDKDGTLTHFDTMWGNWIKSWLDLLVAKTLETHAHAIDQEQLTRELDRSLGFDRPKTSVRPESPVAVSTLAKISTVAMTVLYQNGVNWHEAEEIVGFVASQPVVMTDEMVVPVGRVKETFAAWKQAGIQIIIATSDDRSPTLEAVEFMGIGDSISAYFCGDDPVANKPNPEAIHQIIETYGVNPVNMLMVGDAVSDIAFGRNGKLAGCIAISGGSGDQAALEAAADIVVDSVDKILVKQPY